jgi:hypothetical protein
VAQFTSSQNTSSFKFEWASAGGEDASSAHYKSSVVQQWYDLADDVVGLLQPFLAEEWTERLAVSMKFVEIVSLFSKQEFLSETVGTLSLLDIKSDDDEFSYR